MPRPFICTHLVAQDYKSPSCSVFCFRLRNWVRINSSSEKSLRYTINYSFNPELLLLYLYIFIYIFKWQTILRHHLWIKSISLLSWWDQLILFLVWFWWCKKLTIFFMFISFFVDRISFDIMCSVCIYDLPVSSCIICHAAESRIKV